jgi:hypothetical protein
VEICPRGLVNTGNMCFANVVLQVLVYSPPFWRLFTELGKYIGNGPIVGSGAQKDGKGTPLTDAVITFLREFKPPKPNDIADHSLVLKDGEKPDPRRDSFVPSRFYAALKTKSRFDAMRSGHQEDAEEFLGFLLDTLHEELLTLNAQFGGNNEAAGPATSKDSTASDDTGSVAESDAAVDDEWQEVGKKNRAMITRTVSAMSAPLRMGYEIDVLNRLRLRSRPLLPSLVASSAQCFELLEGPIPRPWSNGVACSWIFRYVSFFDLLVSRTYSLLACPRQHDRRRPVQYRHARDCLDPSTTWCTDRSDQADAHRVSPARSDSARQAVCV